MAWNDPWRLAGTRYVRPKLTVFQLFIAVPVAIGLWLVLLGDASRTGGDGVVTATVILIGFLVLMIAVRFGDRPLYRRTARSVAAAGAAVLMMLVILPLDTGKWVAATALAASALVGAIMAHLTFQK